MRPSSMQQKLYHSSMMEIINTNSKIIIQDLDDSIDLLEENMQMVNPRDVNPMMPYLISPSPTQQQLTLLSGVSSSMIISSSNCNNSMDFLDESAHINQNNRVSLNSDYLITQKDDDPIMNTQKELNMEEFSDLTGLFSGALSNIEDELSPNNNNNNATAGQIINNTPTTTTAMENNNKNNDLKKVKVEYNDAQYYSSSMDDNNFYNDLKLTYLDHPEQIINSSINSKIVGNENNDDLYLYQQFNSRSSSSLSLKNINNNNNDLNNIIEQPHSDDDDDDHDDHVESLLFGKLASFNTVNSFNNNNNLTFNNNYYSPQHQHDNDHFYAHHQLSSASSSTTPINDVGDLTVPENYHHDHFSSYDDDNSKKPKKLNLMLENFSNPMKSEILSTLNTPDVIEGVVQMGNEFNILDLVNNEEISITNIQDDLLLSTIASSSVSPVSAFSSEVSTPLSSPIKKSSSIKSRKRKFSLSDHDEDYDEDDDNDDDYVPPHQSLPKKRHSSINLDSDYDDDDDGNYSSNDSSYHQPSPVENNKKKQKIIKKRGRPRKREDSVSSEGSHKFIGVTKYRELRDKNNEASRKSRLKRKVKEQKYEKEADELFTRNIKLKAQVEELEKMVTTFRNNLFKILISK